MQQKNKSSGVFSERTDALAAALKLSLRELAPVVGISQAMLFAYRSGKYPISEKAWHKLEQAEAGISNQSDTPPSQSAVAEQADVYQSKKNVPFPAWWSRMPTSSTELAVALPHVDARLRLAAILRHEADTKVVQQTELHMSPLHDAFQELGLCGTGFIHTPGFSVLTEAFCAHLAELRVHHARMEIEASQAAAVGLLDKILQTIGARHTNLTTKERVEAEQRLAELKEAALAPVTYKPSDKRHG